MGIVDVVSECCSLPRTHRHLKKRRQFQTVEMKVRIDCEGCERKVKKALEDMKGVSSVEVLPAQHKVTVTGDVDAAKVMRRVAYKTGKRVEPWPYVPYDVVAHPYAPGAYDRKAPPGYVRNVVADPSAAPLARASSTETRYTAAFSDENPNACAVM
ncbi:Heavy metal-associated isoprenylated plant protein 26 [Dichanthelium oligosanthes]|uniref:Heavy metal-associated isoprenylated plant protein 26 n=1 Tax=Dichanthelium oligosanthes TaxID=888268 RepID=A0A1E5VHT8_9POAL|nr:Heavy metal-associated isoprenylated plant protein 26 [Dichanthelium oligosanthes]